MLAGPGTGKTTTMVETILDLIERRGARPESLALTFSRKAAEQLRDRVTARLRPHPRHDRARPSTPSPTPCCGPLRPRRAYAAPLRLLRPPSRTSSCRQLLRPAPEAVAWPPALADAVRTRGFSREVAGLLARARERGLTGRSSAPSAGGGPSRVGGRRAASSSSTSTSSTPRAPSTTPTSSRGRSGSPRTRLSGPTCGAVVRGVRRRVPGHRPGPGRAAASARRRRRATSSSSATPTRRSTGSAGADVRGILDFPDATSRGSTAAAHRCSPSPARAGSARR